MSESMENQRLRLPVPYHITYSIDQCAECGHEKKFHSYPFQCYADFAMCKCKGYRSIIILNRQNEPMVDR